MIKIHVSEHRGSHLTVTLSLPGLRACEEFVLLLQSFPVRKQKKKPPKKPQMELSLFLLFSFFISSCLQGSRKRFCSSSHSLSPPSLILHSKQNCYYHCFSSPLKDCSFLYFKKIHDIVKMNLPCYFVMEEEQIKTEIQHREDNLSAQNLGPCFTV